ncbi:hypothetical protein KR054_007062 [Drosophila jambulina]|nr:hypothetical protein KR054_007062 [Drosophila jambulina]
MAKLITILCFLCFNGLSALPIINLDEIPQTNRCPEDSQRNDTLESCTCLPCAEMPTCSQVLVEVYPGNGEPGSCCPHYECSDREPVCNGTNVTYFPNKCTKCESCNSHAIRCIQFCDLSAVVSNCLTQPNETAIALGETWTENDGCTLCRCTADGERDCQATECLPVDCDRPVRKEGECCQTCPDEAQAPHFSILQPYSGPTRGPETETVSSEGFPLNPDLETHFNTVYSDFYELSSSTTDAEVSSDATSEAPLPETSSTRDLELSSTDSSTDSSIQSTTNGPASTSEASPTSVSDLTVWTSRSPAEQKSTLEPEVQTPESTSQVKAPSPEEEVPRDARNNTDHPSYMSQDLRYNDSKSVLAVVLVVVGAIVFFVAPFVFWKLCKGGKKVNGNYHEVSTQQPQEVFNLKSFDDKKRSISCDSSTEKSI